MVLVFKIMEVGNVERQNDASKMFKVYVNGIRRLIS